MRLIHNSQKHCQDVGVYTTTISCFNPYRTKTQSAVEWNTTHTSHNGSTLFFSVFCGFNNEKSIYKRWLIAFLFLRVVFFSWKEQLQKALTATRQCTDGFIWNKSSKKQESNVSVNIRWMNFDRNMHWILELYFIHLHSIVHLRAEHSSMRFLHVSIG